jgi:acyl carrier protein
MRDDRRAEIRHKVRKLVQELAPEPVDSIEGSDHLVDDLGYHSLAVAELTVALADELGFDLIPPEETVDVETVAQVEELVFRLLEESERV